MSPALTSVKKFFLTAGLLIASFNCVADSAVSMTNDEQAAAESIAATSSAQSSVTNQLQSAASGEVSQTTGDTVGVSLAPSVSDQLPAPSVSNQLPATSANTQAYPAQNNPRAQPQPAPKIGSGAHLLNVTFGLLLIIGLIFGISWFVRRFSQGTFAANTHMKIIATMPLGTRERLVLIDVGGQQLLLGITSTQINTLHVFDSPIAASPGEANNSEFGRKLMAILQRSAPGEQNTQKNSGQE